MPLSVTWQDNAITQKKHCMSALFCHANVGAVAKSHLGGFLLFLFLALAGAASQTAADVAPGIIRFVVGSANASWQTSDHSVYRHLSTLPQAGMLIMWSISFGVPVKPVLNKLNSVLSSPWKSLDYWKEHTGVYSRFL
uniref:Uncharacterized protein n=1 Tax=Oryza brachyantha TaxID=4533 RepID=J3LA65_ORYBR